VTLVLCAHGTRSAEGRAAVRSVVAAVAEQAGEPVLEAYVDVHGPTPAQVLRPGATVVPLFLATGYHVSVDISRAAEQVPDVAVARPLGPSPLLAEMLASRLDQERLRPGDAVVLAAAGSSDGRSAAAARATGRRLGELLGRAVDVAFGASRRPSVAEGVAAARSDGADRVVVASYLLATGHFHGLLLGSGADAVTPPLVVPGERVDPRLVRLVRDRAEQARRRAAAA
jgi:sirohydrochlorin ferrochelatase